jgi:hypothetical protein
MFPRRAFDGHVAFLIVLVLDRWRNPTEYNMLRREDAGIFD